jgi:hypothetical protein
MQNSLVKTLNSSKTENSFFLDKRTKIKELKTLDV